MEKLIPKLKTHFEWLGKQSIAPILTPNTLKILCNGGFYIGGRDKFYRPTVIMDGGVMAQMAKDDKTMMEAALEEMWFYLYNYIRKVLFLPGMVDTWVFLCDLNGLSFSKLPRK